MNKRILVIDDEEAVRKAFCLALEDEPCDVTAVDSGVRGIEEAGKGRFDLIFLDLRMPGMNGVETLRALRKIDAQVPVYIITAFYEEFFAELKQANRDGIAFELAEKPIAAEQIVMIVKGIFEGTRSF